MSFQAMAGSLAHAGISPQRSMASATPGTLFGPRSGVGGTYDGDVLAWCYVVAGPQVERRADEVHPLVQLPPCHALGEAAAHGIDITHIGGGLSCCSCNVPVAGSADMDEKLQPPGLAGRPAVHRRVFALWKAERFWPKKRRPGDHDRLKPVAWRVVEHLELCGIRCFGKPLAPHHSTPDPWATPGKSGAANGGKDGEG